MIGQLLDGRYQIVQVLGGGGFGQTFLAKDIKRPGHPLCVVKQLRYLSNNPQALQTARRLFKQEAEILEKLGQHNQIPTLLADLEENQEFYLVQQFIPGHSLKEEILPGQPWTEDKVINLLKEVLEILAFVHGQGVIHRDIKPANIMRRFSDGKLVLIDFGSVKEIGTQINHRQSPATVIGTPGYMPIEQMHGQPQLNSDIYALGMIAIQALLGLDYQELIKLPDPNTNEVRWRNRRQVSASLTDVITKMVLPDYMWRYQSRGEVLADLEKTSAGSGRLDVWSKIISFIQTIQQGKSLKSQRLILAGIAILIVFGGLAGVFYSQSSYIAEYFLDRGMEKVDKGDNKGAIEDFNQAIRFNPNLAQAYYNRGVVCLLLGDKAGAIEDFTKTIRLNPIYAKAYINRGGTRSALGDKLRAIEDYTQAILLKPDFAAYYNRGNARFYLGEYRGAIEDFTQAIQIKPDFAIAYANRCSAHNNLKEHLKAVEDCTQALLLNHNLALAYNNRGVAHLNLKDYPGAIKDLTKVIQINPNLAQAYLNRGLARTNLRDYKGAIDDFNQTLRRNPKEAKAYLNRGNARFLLKDKQGAIEDYTKAIKLKPDLAQAYNTRGITRANLGNKLAAIKDFQQAAKICSERGWTGCYNDAQNLIKKVQ